MKNTLECEEIVQEFVKTLLKNSDEKYGRK